MKKTFATFLVIALFLCLPCNHSLAYSQTDLVLHTRDSVSGFASGTYQEYLDAVYIPSFSLDFYDIIGRLPSDDPIFSFDHFIVFGTNNSIGIFGFNSPDNSNVGMLYCDWYPDSNYGSDGYYIKVPSNVSISNYGCYMYNNNAQVWTPNTSSFSIYQDGANLFYIGSQYKYYVFDTDLFITVDKQGTMYQLFPNGYQNLDNMNPEGLPYVDTNGNIVSPVEYESNKNHMYFKDCEIGFCYPKNSASPSSFGGAYFYIKYQVDDWIVNHISDYDLVFYADCEVGNDLINTIRYQIALDPDGCITIPFSRLWSTPLNHKGFSVLVTDSLVEDNFYKAYLYSLSSSSFVDFGARTSSYNGDANIVDALSALLDRNIAAFLYYTYDTDVEVYTDLSVVGDIVAQKYNPFLIDAFTLLTSGDDNSGLFEMEFDLVAGTEDVTDTSGIVNPDPFVPDDTNDPDFTPPAPSPGNSTTPSIIVNTGGTWNGVINGVIGYDPGYTQLKNDINANPDANFSQYLAPFRDNEVGGFVSDFLDDMPTAMKSIFIGGFGVLTLLGIYRFIRRG